MREECMNAFYKETEGIYRLRVPFENIYTSVFLLTAAERPILVDCATTASDVDECILPALAALGYALSDIGAIVLTHRHADHAGGLARILFSHAYEPWNEDAAIGRAAVLSCLEACASCVG